MDKDDNIINRIKVIRGLLEEPIEISGLYLAFNFPRKGVSKAKNKRMFPRGSKITEEQFEVAQRQIEFYGELMDKLYNDLSPAGKHKLDYGK